MKILFGENLSHDPEKELVDWYLSLHGWQNGRQNWEVEGLKVEKDGGEVQDRVQHVKWEIIPMYWALIRQKETWTL